MAMNFKTDFELKLQNALEKGGYKTSSEFARAITSMYMQTVVKGKPIGVPATLPSPALQGSPAPVGPPVPIPYKKREQVFYNTVRAYFVAKEISQGKAAIEFLTRDLQSIVSLGVKLKQEAQQNIERIRQIDDEVAELREQIKSIGPAVQDFIKTKKDTFKNLKKDFDTLLTRLSEVTKQEIGDTAEQGAKAAFAKELGLLDSIQNFKFDLKQVRALLADVTSILQESSEVVKKYENDFSTTANIRMYIWKKIQAFFKEIFELLGAFIDPMSFANYFRELIQVPGARAVGRVMLKIINKNKILKEKKKKLIQAVNENFHEIKYKVQKKITEIQKKIQEKADKVLGFVSNSSLVKHIKSAVKKAREELKKVEDELAFAAKVVKYFFDLFRQGVALYDKVLLIVDSVKEFINKYVDEEIIQKTKDKIAAIKTRLNNVEPTEPVKIDAIFKQYEITQEPLKIILENLMNAKKLLAPDILEVIKRPTTKLTATMKALETFLEKDLGNFIHSIENPPTRENKNKKKKKTNTVPAQGETVKPRKFTIKSVLRKVKDILKKLEHWIAVIRKKVEKKQQDAIKKLKKTQNEVTDYIATVTNFDANKKKIDNKKRDIEQQKAETEQDMEKAKRIAKAAILFSKMTQSGYKVLDRITPSRTGSPPDYTMGSNEGDILDFYKYYGQWLILQNDSDQTRIEVAKNTKRLKRKIKDFVVYENIIEFFAEALKEAKESGFKDYLKEKLKEQGESLKEQATSEWKSAADSIIQFFENPPKTISELVTFPLDVVSLLDANVDILKGENRFLTRLKIKTKALANKIPADTEDPTLLFFKRQLEKGVGFLTNAIKLVKEFEKKVVKFINEELIEPATNKVQSWIDRTKTKYQNEKEERIRKRFDKEFRKKIDIAAASAVFGLAGRLFWTGFNWQNPAGTTFVVLNVAPFTPMNPDEINGSAGFAQQLKNGFEMQVVNMTGISIPNPSYALAPVPFQGYS